jgi:hypothetical protein
MGRACSSNRIEVIGGKPEGRRPIGRQKHRWMDNTFFFVVPFYLRSLLVHSTNCI